MSQPETERPRLLVVDDERPNQLVLCDILEPQGYDVQVASSAEEALRSIEARTPDLVLCDVAMGRMSGFDLLRTLKERRETRHVPFVLVTGRRDLADRVRGLEQGADDYLLKPIEAPEVLARVRATLRLGAHRQILSERAKFEAVMGEMADGLVHAGGDGRIRSANAAARRLLDLPDGSLGAIDVLAHLCERFTTSATLDSLRLGRPGPGQLRFEATRTVAGAPRLDLSVAASRVDVPGEERGDLVLCVRDVTLERQEARVKDRFLALMSHKVLTPLTVLLGHVDLLSNEDAQNLRGEQSASLGAIERSAHDLRALFERVVGFADLAVNETKIQPVLERLSRVAEQATVAAERWRGRVQIDVRVTPPSPDRLVVVDPHFTACAIDNLVENSVKFCGRDRVSIRVETVPASSPLHAALAITDDGPGVPPELSERVFDRFDQIDADFTGNVEGLGLGLPLVRRIIEKQGGSVRLRSSLGRGTTVILELPLSPPAATAPCAVA